MMLRTSAKSTLISPGTLMSSDTLRMSWVTTSSAVLNASIISASWLTYRSLAASLTAIWIFGIRPGSSAVGGGRHLVVTSLLCPQALMQDRGGAFDGSHRDAPGSRALA